jgi:hypothetical protein
MLERVPIFERGSGRARCGSLEHVPLLARDPALPGWARHDRTAGIGPWLGCSPAPSAEHLASSGEAIRPNQKLAASVGDGRTIVAIAAHAENAADQEKCDADEKREAAPRPHSTPGDEVLISAAGRFSPWRVRHRNPLTSDRALQAGSATQHHPPHENDAILRGAFRLADAGHGSVPCAGSLEESPDTGVI